MVGWHHKLNGHEFEQALGGGEGQESLACCSPWDHKELDMIEPLNNSNNMSTESTMLSNHLILCPLPSVFPSIKVFLSKSALCIRWPKYWSVSFSISPSEEYSGLISFRMDWFDLLAAQGTLKSLLQHHILKELILQHSAFLMVQLLHPYMLLLLLLSLFSHVRLCATP